MTKSGEKFYVAFGGVLLFLFFIVYAYVVNLRLYIADSLVFIGLIILFYFLYDHLNMTPFSYIVLIISFALHNAGVFGWYYKSPLPYVDILWEKHISAHPFQWDHITHIVGIFAITLIFFQYLSKFFSKSKINNVILIFLIVLSGMGIGALIEHYEFAGFLFFGEGEGGLAKGTGDFTGNWASSDWINAMWDLVYNTLGALLAVALGYFMYKSRS